MSLDNTLVVVSGPTAVGKTHMAIELAKHFNTEIISADSRQVFRELNIGTAKPSAHELQMVKHHFINSHSIAEEYDAAQFADDALKIINSLFKTHKYVIVCGGSGLYIRALLEGFDDIPEVDPGIRAELISRFEQDGLAYLQERMQVLDPELLDSIDRQNPHRLIRALEVRIGTGKSISSFQIKKKLFHDFRIVKIGLELPREQLYERIDRRMDSMIGEGLFDEAQHLISYREHQALQTVGYQEIFEHFDGAYDKEEAIRLLKRNSRRYAKRQLTWFKRDPEIKWFSPNDFDLIVHEILSQPNS